VPQQLQDPSYESSTQKKNPKKLGVYENYEKPITSREEMV